MNLIITGKFQACVAKAKVVQKFKQHLLIEMDWQLLKDWANY